jgi:hypothetical protein
MTRCDARLARHYCAPAPSPEWVKGRPKNGPAQQVKSLPLNPQRPEHLQEMWTRHWITR